MYGLETIDGKMVIYGIKDVYFPEAHMHSPACTVRPTKNAKLTNN
jgi:hypothetical protein